MNPQTNFDKLQNLLRQIFQFDSADLDFGIYRILNQKRDRIEEFITKDLVKVVSAELDKGVLAEQSQAVRELKNVFKQIREALGEEAIDADGNLNEKYHTVKIGKKYLDLKEKTTGASSRSSLEVVIFNHLYTFFSRYYDSGDFMSKRRYSKREKYAIPYNGEEVFLHWTNNDQYYIKTGEYFFNYTFTSGGIKVHFKPQNAQVEQGNIKGNKRFFIPLTKEASFDAEGKVILVPFEYRPFTTQEEIKYGKKNQQDLVISEALEAIPKRFKGEKEALVVLMAERRKTAEGKSISYLEHHLRRYTRRNTFDFFIHKDLKGFLERELNFYIKNEVLNVDELDATGEGRAESWFQIMQVLKSIGKTIISFLAQIEDFQKKLFEKKKFITETEYCITMGNIPERLYTDISSNEAQWMEWKRLLLIDEIEPKLFSGNRRSTLSCRLQFLKNYFSLTLDTRHFDCDFKDKLLASYDDFEQLIDGILVHGENFQALNLMIEKFRSNLKCIYIDPPYNTGNDEFIYKDSYQHSSWLTMIRQLLPKSIEMLDDTGAFFVSCDENEVFNLGPLLLSSFGASNHVETTIWNKRVPKNDKGIGNIHEYIFLFVKDAKFRRDHGLSFIMRKDGLSEVYEIVKKAKRKGLSLEKAQQELKKYYRKQEFDRGITLYCELDPNYEIWGKINMAWPNPQTEGPRYEVLNPITKRPVPIPKKGWRWKKETFVGAEENGPTYKLPDGSMMKGHIWYAPDEKTQPSSITYLREVEAFLLRSILSLKSDGSLTIEAMGLPNVVDYPKPTLLNEWLFYSTSESEGWFLDYFAGTGTSGHAIINLNRQDNSRRRYILVDFGMCFESVLKARLLKTVYTKEWSKGKPVVNGSGVNQFIKYHRLESYEDALNNISFKLPKGQKTLQFDDYLVNYMLDFETKECETFLNVKKMGNPFAYKLVFNGDQERKEKPVDLPETFNYLFGLYVKTRRVYLDKGRRYLVYRGTVDHRDVVVIWRNTEGWNKKELEQDKKFVTEQKLAEKADEIFVNGDSFIPGAKAIESVFKQKMFESV